MKNEFVTKRDKDGVITVFFGDPDEIGGEAEFVCLIHKSCVSDLIESLEKENK